MGAARGRVAAAAAAPQPPRHLQRHCAPHSPLSRHPPICKTACSRRTKGRWAAQSGRCLQAGTLKAETAAWFGQLSMGHGQERRLHPGLAVGGALPAWLSLALSQPPRRPRRQAGRRADTCRACQEIDKPVHVCHAAAERPLQPGGVILVVCCLHQGRHVSVHNRLRMTVPEGGQQGREEACRVPRSRWSCTDTPWQRRRRHKLTHCGLLYAALAGLHGPPSTSPPTHPTTPATHLLERVSRQKPLRDGSAQAAQLLQRILTQVALCAVAATAARRQRAPAAGNRLPRSLRRRLPAGAPFAAGWLGGSPTASAGAAAVRAVQQRAGQHLRELVGGPLPVGVQCRLEALHACRAEGGRQGGGGDGVALWTRRMAGGHPSFSAPA